MDGKRHGATCLKGGIMENKIAQAATNEIRRIRQQRDRWRLLAAVGIALNVLALILWGMGV